MDPNQRARLEELNTDHHRRMAVMHVGQPDDRVRWWMDRDEESRRLIVDAMLGCQHRAQMKIEGEDRGVLNLGSGSARDRDYLMQRFEANYCGIGDRRDAVRLGWQGAVHLLAPRHGARHQPRRGALGDQARLGPARHRGRGDAARVPRPGAGARDRAELEEWMGHYRRHGLRPVYAKLENMACVEAHIVCIHEEWAARVLGP
jgi:hypothetical protein